MSLIPRLQEDIAAHIAALESEVAALRQALQALSADSSQPRERPRRKRRHQNLVDVLHQQPGARASMLALERGQSADAVSAALSALEQDGCVQREGLGWRVVEGRTSHYGNTD